MKKIILVLAGITFTNLFAQIPNSNFEDWTLDGGGNLNPDYWLSPNDQSSGYTPVVQATGYMSTYAMRVYTPNLGGFNLPSATLLSFANTQRPASVTGMFRGAWTSGDSSYVNVTLTENGNPVGAGVKYFSQDQATFTSFSIPINYANANTPDTMFIAVGSGFGAPTTPGAELIIDQLGFNITGIETNSNDAVQSVLYDQSTSSLFIHLNSMTDSKLQMDILSLSGQQLTSKPIFTTAGESYIAVPVAMNPGLYIIRISGNGVNYSQKIVVTQ